VGFYGSVYSYSLLALLESVEIVFQNKSRDKEEIISRERIIYFYGCNINLFGVKTMKLLTKAIEKKLPALYSQEKVKDPMVVFKLFTPTSSFTWFVLEGEKQEDGDWMLFTKCYSHMCPEGELGYSSLNELKSVRGPFGLGVERDLHFTPKPLSQCKGF